MVDDATLQRLVEAAAKRVGGLTRRTRSSPSAQRCSTSRGASMRDATSRTLRIRNALRRSGGARASGDGGWSACDCGCGGRCGARAGHALRGVSAEATRVRRRRRDDHRCGHGCGTAHDHAWGVVAVEFRGGGICDEMKALRGRRDFCMSARAVLVAKLEKARLVEWLRFCEDSNSAISSCNRVLGLRSPSTAASATTCAARMRAVGSLCRSRANNPSGSPLA